MPSDAYERGFGLGSAIANGVTQWKQIQQEKQQRKRFEGAVSLYNQRRIAAQQAVDPTTDEQLNEFQARIQRNPDASLEEVPVGVGAGGEVENDRVIRTSEGDVSVRQVQQLKARKRQEESSLMSSEVDGIMEMLAADPENPLVQQFAAAKYATIQQKLAIRTQQAAEMNKQIEFQLASERNQLERKQFEAAPERARDQETFQTNERVRGDLTIAEGKAKIEARNPKGPAEGDISGMRKEFGSASQDFVKVRDAYSRIQSIGNDSSPAGDVALIFSFIRILDPGSTVREGEFATAEQTRGVPDTVVQQYNKALRGERLSPGQRQDFAKQAGNLYSAQERNQKKLEGQFRSLAERRGMNPEDVVLDIGAAEAPAGGPPAAGGITPEQARAELERRRSAR